MFSSIKKRAQKFFSTSQTSCFSRRRQSTSSESSSISRPRTVSSTTTSTAPSTPTSESFNLNADGFQYTVTDVDATPKPKPLVPASVKRRVDIDPFAKDTVEVIDAYSSFSRTSIRPGSSSSRHSIDSSYSTVTPPRPISRRASSSSIGGQTVASQDQEVDWTLRLGTLDLSKSHSNLMQGGQDRSSLAAADLPDWTLSLGAGPPLCMRMHRRRRSSRRLHTAPATAFSSFSACYEAQAAAPLPQLPSPQQAYSHPPSSYTYMYYTPPSTTSSATTTSTYTYRPFRQVQARPPSSSSLASSLGSSSTSTHAQHPSAYRPSTPTTLYISLSDRLPVSERPLSPPPSWPPPPPPISASASASSSTSSSTTEDPRTSKESTHSSAQLTTTTTSTYETCQAGEDASLASTSVTGTSAYYSARSLPEEQSLGVGTDTNVGAPSVRSFRTGDSLRKCEHTNGTRRRSATLGSTLSTTPSTTTSLGMHPRAASTPPTTPPPRSLSINPSVRSLSPCPNSAPVPIRCKSPSPSPVPCAPPPLPNVVVLTPPRRLPRPKSSPGHTSPQAESPFVVPPMQGPIPMAGTGKSASANKTTSTSTNTGKNRSTSPLPASPRPAASPETHSTHSRTSVRHVLSRVVAVTGLGPQSHSQGGMEKTEEGRRKAEKRGGEEVRSCWFDV